jgi:hypothetical protein
MIRDVLWLENRMSCWLGVEEALVAEDLVQFLLDCMSTMLAIVPSKSWTYVWNLDEFKLMNAVVEVILVPIPLHVPSYMIISMHNGIEVPCNTPGQAVTSPITIQGIPIL